MPRCGTARRRTRPGAAAAPETRTLQGSEHGDDPGTCRLAFVLAEGLRHIAERRSKPATRRSTMRLRQPTRRTIRTMPAPRPAARTRRRTRIRRRDDGVSTR